MNDVAVLDVQLHERSIGTLTLLQGDKVLFAFRDAYIEDLERPTLSLSFKDAFGQLITQSKPTQTRLPRFFANLLPEGPLRAYLAERAGVKPEREFFLAWVLGRDLPGAVRILPVDGEALPPDDRDGTRSDGAEGAKTDEAPLRFSLAGVQLKFSAIQKATGGLTIPVDGVGGSWIVKLPSTHFAGVPENEFAMMELARQVGINVPETKLVPVSTISGLPRGIELTGDMAFAIKRFDRSENGEAVHIEDFAQVFRVYPERKYTNASYLNIAKVLWVETGESGIMEFTRRIVFNALIGNADMHLKNWSLIYPDRRNAALAPAYDFVSTITYMDDDKMALSFVDSKSFASITMDQFERFAAKAGLPQKMVQDTARDTVVAFAKAWGDSKGAAIAKKTRLTINAHLETIPLWKELAQPRHLGGTRMT